MGVSGPVVKVAVFREVLRVRAIDGDMVGRCGIEILGVPLRDPPTPNGPPTPALCPPPK